MITYKPIAEGRLIAELSANWPYSQEEVYTALENEEYFGNDDRTYCHDIKSPILKSIYDSAMGSAQELFQVMLDQHQFSTAVWGLDFKEQLANNTKLSGHFVCDKPGYNTSVHIDCRIQVCTGMLFFNSFDDIDQATTFYTDHNNNNPIRMSSKYGSGWYAANTHDCWHIGANNTQRNRYAILFINELNLK
jgi:hypothetical protein